MRPHFEGLDRCLWRWLPHRALQAHARGDRQLSNEDLGWLGELHAARFARALGDRVVARRLLTRWGELDLVLRSRETLIVCEVKTGRSGPQHAPGDRFDEERRARLSLAARGLARRVRASGSRVDLLEVRLHAEGDVETRRSTVAG